MTFLPMLPPGKKNFERESNPHTITSIHIFIRISILANLTPPTKQPFKLKSEFKYHDHVSNS